MKTLFIIISVLLASAFLSSCNSCPEIACVNTFEVEGVTLKGFNLNSWDTILYVKYPKGDLQNPVDSFVVYPENATLCDLPNCASAKLYSFDINHDWKIITPTKEEYTITDAKIVSKECAKCTFGHTYFDEHEMKVNGEIQTGNIVITK